MQSSQVNYQTYKQCPICYNESAHLQQVCINEHKICQKCLFSLQKRSCPFCKENFRVVKNRNGGTYEIVFGQEDRQHENMVRIKNVQREHAQMMRNYHQSMAQHQNHANFVQHAHHQAHHHNHHSYHQHNHAQYLNHQHHTHHTNNFPNQNQFLIPSEQLSQQDYEQAFDSFLFPRESEIYQSDIRMVYVNQQNQERQHQVNMRDPEYRETHELVKRVLRRQRDQDMYNEEVRARVNEDNDGRSKEEDRKGVKLEIKNKNNQEQSQGGFIQKVGRFLIGIGQKLTKKQTVKEKYVQQMQENQQQEHIKDTQPQRETYGLRARFSSGPIHTYHNSHSGNQHNSHYPSINHYQLRPHQCTNPHHNHSHYPYSHNHNHHFHPSYIYQTHPQQYPNFHHQYHLRHQQHHQHNYSHNFHQMPQNPHLHHPQHHQGRNN